MERRRPDRKVTVRFRYKGPEQQLVDRLVAVATRRRQLGEELGRLHRFLDKHPDLRSRIASIEERLRPRLVVDNTAKRRQIKRRASTAPDG